MVDVEYRHAAEQLAVRIEHGPDAFELAAVTDDEQVVVDRVVGRLAEAVHARHELVHGRHRVRAYRRRHSPTRLDEQADGERGAESVRLGIFVADGQDALCGAQPRHDFVGDGFGVGSEVHLRRPDAHLVLRLSFGFPDAGP